MCLAIPVKIVVINENKRAIGEIGGVERELDITFVPDVKVGEYVFLHAGFAIQVLNENEARESMKLWNEILSTE